MEIFENEENVNFGRKLDRDKIFVTTLKQFEDIILYTLEGYLFKTKFGDQYMKIAVPLLGKTYTYQSKPIIDIHSCFEIPEFSFDENGCLYTEGDESVYVSPEYFAKCFIERALEVWIALITLVPKKKAEKINEIGPVDLSFLKHMNFIGIHNKLVAIKRTNESSTKGLVGLIPDFNDKERILYLRKIEIAAQIQKVIEEALDIIGQEISEEKVYDLEYDNSELYESDEYEKLVSEHSVLFRMGPFEEALEPNIWETKGRIYDNGTDEEREDWRQRYENLKKEFENKKIKKIEEIKKTINFTEQLPLENVKNGVINYLKRLIVTYNYRVNQGAYNNPLKTKLGLDQTAYYGHPADKYIFDLGQRLSFDYSSEDDYDELYLNIDDSNYALKRRLF